MRISCISLTIVLYAASVWGQKAPLPRELPPYGPESPVAAPAVKASTLDNGLTVWMVSEPGFPKTALGLVVRGGLSADPADRPGISILLAKTLDQGTKTRTARQIAQELQGSGGDLTAQPGSDFLLISTSFLSAKTEKALTVFADVVREAGFFDQEVALAKRNAIDHLQQQESQPSFLASRAMAKVLFGEHPYHVTAPTHESIVATTPADLRRIYTERFRPDQALLVVVGDFENDRMLSQIKDRFASWAAPATAPLPAPPAFSAAPQHAIFVVPRAGSVQTTLRVALAGPLRGDPDYEAAMVANAIYGGTFGSRLVTNIREDKGYTYSPSASLLTYRAAGLLTTRADVRNEVTGPTVNEIMYELNRLATTAPTKEELTQAQRFLVGSEAIQLQSREAVASALARLWVNGLPPEELGIYGRKIASTSTEDVNRAARKYFPAAKAAIVAVGEENVIREAVSPFGIPIKAVP